MSSDDLKILAGEAQMLLSHPLLKGALDTIRENTVQAIEDGDITDDILRDKLMITLQVVKEVRLQLYSHIENEQMDSISPEVS